MGEPAGIGGEIALKAWLRRSDGVPPFYLIDGPRRLSALAAPGTNAVMMLACPELRVVPVTIHLALRQAIKTLSSAMIVAAGRVTHAALMQDFGVAAPVIAVAGLNPHAGEGGSLGREDLD